MKPRLIYVCQSFLETNGWGRLAQSMTQEALQAGYEVYTSSADGSAVQGAKRGPPIFDIHDSVPKKILQAIKWLVWIRTLPKHDASTTLHLFSEPQMCLALWVGRMNSVGTLCGTYVDPHQHGSRVFSWLFKKSLDRIDHLLAISDYTRSRVESRWRDRIQVIPLGVSNSLLSRPWKQVTQHEHVDYKILSVGAVKPRKGFLELIHGFHAFMQAHPDKTGALAILGSTKGSQEYTDLLQKTIMELGEEKNIFLTGSVQDSELYGWYRWCDAFALTPIDDGGGFEGFGLVYLEANLFGKPCLGVTSTGATQAIGPDSGVIASGIGSEALAEGFKKLFHPPQPFDPMAWANIHSWDKVFSIYTKFYF